MEARVNRRVEKLPLREPNIHKRQAVLQKTEEQKAAQDQRNSEQGWFWMGSLFTRP
jgi:hypothetical protein